MSWRWAAGFLVLMGCELQPAYERTNPFDPGSPIPMRLVGVPDTLTSIGDRFTAVIERDPPLSPLPTSILWESKDPRTLNANAFWLVPLGYGEYVVSPSASAEMRTTSIGAMLNDAITVGRNLVVGQLVDTLRLGCGSAITLTACDAAPRTPGSAFTVFSRSRDARGNGVNGLFYAMERAAVTVRTPTVVTSEYAPNGFGNYAFRAGSAGETWIVIRVDRSTDSVRIVVAP